MSAFRQKWGWIIFNLLTCLVFISWTFWLVLNGIYSFVRFAEIYCFKRFSYSYIFYRFMHLYFHFLWLFLTNYWSHKDYFIFLLFLLLFLLCSFYGGMNGFNFLRTKYLALSFFSSNFFKICRTIKLIKLIKLIIIFIVKVILQFNLLILIIILILLIISSLNILDKSHNINTTDIF